MVPRVPGSGLIQPISAGVLGAVTGFASAFAIVLVGLRAAGATDAQAASGLFALCLGQAVLAIVLSLAFRLPLSFAWSTPGAALLVASQASGGDFAAAVGAFLVCGLLIAITGLWPALRTLVTRIPTPISSAMLAGVLLPICLAPVLAAARTPLLVLPTIVVWGVLQRLRPALAVPGAMLSTIVVVALTVGTAPLGLTAPELVFVAPQFPPLVLVSLGVPLYLVTMAGQNVPGFAVLSVLGYRRVPARAILVSSGLLSSAASLLGGHVMNLSAITAAMMAGPEAHRDPARRWIATVTGGAVYVLLGLCSAAAAALVTAAPEGLIAAAAGLALLGAFGTALTSAVDDPRYRLTSALTFVTVVSGIAVAGIGSAFWGLLVGFLCFFWAEHRAGKGARVTADERLGGDE